MQLNCNDASFKTNASEIKAALETLDGEHRGQQSIF